MMCGVEDVVDVEDDCIRDSVVGFGEGVVEGSEFVVLNCCLPAVVPTG